MKEATVSLNLQELLALKATALAVVATINLLVNDYELGPGQSVDLTEAERATLFTNSADSPIAKTWTIGKCLVRRHETLALHFVILRGSILPIKTASSCPAAAAKYRAEFFANPSQVNADGLVLQDLCLAASKSVVASVCFSYAANGPKYLPD